MKEFLVTATVQFVVKAMDEAQAEHMAQCCLLTPLSTCPRNKEFPSPRIEGIEDITV